jgi:hypothetical protein
MVASNKAAAQIGFEKREKVIKKAKPKKKMDLLFILLNFC